MSNGDDKDKKKGSGLTEAAEEVLRLTGTHLEQPATNLPPPIAPPIGQTAETAQYQEEVRKAAAEKYWTTREWEKAEAAQAKFTEVGTVTKATRSMLNIDWRFPWELPAKGAMKVPILPFMGAELTIKSPEEWEAEVRELQEATRIATENSERATWRWLMLYWTPEDLQADDAPETFEEFEANWEESFLTEEDREWMRGLYERLSHFIPPKLPPEFEGKSPKEKRDELWRIINAKPDRPYGDLNSMTAEEIAKVFAWPNLEPDMPEGLTTEDIRAILTDLEVPEGEQDEILALEHKAEDTQKLWAEVASYYDLVKAGIVDVEAPDLDAKQFAALLFTQPVVAGIDAFEWWRDRVAKPWAAQAIIGVKKILWPQAKTTAAAELEAIHKDFIDKGHESWEAYKLAFEDWGTNPALKMFYEIALDPLNWIGFGVFTKIAYVTNVAGKFPYLGRFVGAIESGWLQAWDIPFRGVRATWNLIPKTPMQRALLNATNLFIRTLGFVERILPGHAKLKGLKANEVIDVLRGSVRAAKNRATANTEEVMMGRHLSGYDYIPKARIADWLSDFGVKVEIVTDHIQAIVNDSFDRYMWGAKGGAQEMATDLIKRLGFEVTPKTVNKLKATVSKYRTKIFADAEEQIVGATPRDVISGIKQRSVDLEMRKALDPLTRFVQQGSRLAYWLGKKSDTFTHSQAVAWWDRHVTAPFANMQLLFFAYGPFNVLEGMGRNLTGAGTVFYPRRAFPSYEYAEITQGFKNRDYELVRFYEEGKRLEVAMADVVTGKTIMFGEHGLLPLVTRSFKNWHITLPGPGGKKFVIRSWSDLNNMFGDVVHESRAWYNIVKFKQNLVRTAPKQTAEITSVMEKNRHWLNEVKYLGKEGRQNYERVIEQASIAGPSPVEAHLTDKLTIQNSIAAQKVQQEALETHNIYSPVKQSIFEDVESGRIWGHTDEYFDNYWAGIQEFNMVGVLVEAKHMDDLARQFIDTPPQTVEQMYTYLNSSADLMRGIGERVTEVRAIAFAREATLNPSEIDKYWRGVNKALDEYIKVNGVKMENLINSVNKAAAKAELKLSQSAKAKLTEMMDAVQLANYEMSAWRMKDTAILEKYLSPELSKGVPNPQFIPAKRRDNEVWRMIRGERDPLYAKFHEGELTLVRQLEALRAGAASALGIADVSAMITVPVIVGKLQPQHVAAILGCNSYDLHKALTTAKSIMTVKPKDEFVELVYGRVMGGIKKLKDGAKATPESMGFTREAIGDVYDEMWRMGGFDPIVMSSDPLIIAKMDLEKARAAVKRLELTKSISADDYENQMRYIQGVANDLRETSMYKVPAAVGKGKKIVGEKAVIGPPEKKLSEVLLDETTWAKMPPEVQALGERRVAGLTDEGYEELAKGLEEYAATLTKRAAGRKTISTAVTKLRKGRMEIEVAARPPKPLKPVREGTDEWWDLKEAAHAQTRKDYALDYTQYGYDQTNILDAHMRLHFPFWSYEWQRWPWLARTFLRHPGVFGAGSRYMDYTEGGYMPIPGTNWEVNPTSGTVFMSGGRKLYLKDYPEYYDAFPGMEAVDYIQRFGFYPGFIWSALITGAGAIANKPEVAEMFPSWLKTPLYALRGAAPQTAGKIMDMFLPNRYLDFLTMKQLYADGYDADALYRKKMTQGLTDEEERIWLKARAIPGGWVGAIALQTGGLRFNPKEWRDYLKLSREAITEMTGVPEAVQLQIQRHRAVTGKSLPDYFPLDILQQKAYAEIDAIDRARGITTPLIPSSWQELDRRIADYYEFIEKESEKYRKDGWENTRGADTLAEKFLSKEIGPDEYTSAHGDLLSGLSAAVREVGEELYPDVPKTMDERIAHYKERGNPVPYYGPDKELLQAYYEIEPELKWNWEKQKDAYDWTTYYAKINAVLNSLAPDFQQRFLDRIQYSWNSLETLQWNTYRTYIRPYNAVREIALEQYTPEQRRLIQIFEKTRGKEREAIRAVIDENTGEKLISSFARTLSEARQQLRRADPEMESWLYFWGEIDTFKSKEGEIRWQNLDNQLRQPGMLTRR